jgi:hypothetical protein
MSPTENALHHLARVREAVRSPQHGYVFRTRLRRSVLAAMRSVASCIGTTLPDSPDEAMPNSKSPQVQDLSALITKIRSSSDYLCQPSEALEQRWILAWDELQLDLRDLEDSLRRLGA